MIVSDITYQAMRIAGVLRGAGHSYASTTPAAADALLALQNMILVWNANRLRIPNLTTYSYNTVGNTQSYQIGPSAAGSFAGGPRPERIERANVLFNTSPSVRRPLVLLTTAQWAARAVRQVYSIPLELYNDGAAPISTLFFYPIPDDVYTIEMFCWQALTAFVTAGDAVQFPPGYEEAVIYNLAKRLAALWRTQLTPDAQEIAKTSLEEIQSKNSQSPAIYSGGSRSGGGLYNYLKGTS
jgi:hypothetical protein